MKISKKLKPVFSDERGDITKIIDDGKTVIKSVLLITSKPNSIRANHYHKRDSHYCYLLSGKMEYFERGIKGGKVNRKIVTAGQMVFTPPLIVHTMRFLEKTSFLTLATEWRKKEAYENDIVRVKLIES